MFGGEMKMGRVRATERTSIFHIANANIYASVRY